MNITYYPFTLAYQVRNSTAAALRGLLLKMHAAAALVRGAATYGASGR